MKQLIFYAAGVENNVAELKKLLWENIRNWLFFCYFYWALSSTSVLCLTPLFLNDGNYITNNLAIRIMWFKGMWDFFSSRFIALLTFALNYHFNGLNVIGYHIVNLAIYITSAILVFLFCYAYLFCAGDGERLAFEIFPANSAFYCAHLFKPPPANRTVTYLYGSVVVVLPDYSIFFRSIFILNRGYYKLMTAIP